MSIRNTLVKLKRTLVSHTDSKLLAEELQLGEPLIIDNTEGNHDSNVCKYYMAVGSTSRPTDTAGGNSILKNSAVGKSPIFKAFKDFNSADSVVYKSANNYTVGEDLATEVSARSIQAKLPNSEDTHERYYLLGQPGTTTKVDGTYEESHVYKFKVLDKDNEPNEAGIYIDKNAVLHGAAWNDYAEYRTCNIEEPGSVVVEKGDGTLVESTKRLSPLPYVISDTYGMVIGDENDSAVPVAVCGRALVIVDTDKVKVGDCLCAGVNGKASVMSQDEIMYYPDRILGIVSQIPTEDTWNNVKIGERVWIKVQ